MRLLFATGISGCRLPPPLLAEEQILCGPDWADRALGDYVISMASPLGEYDLATLADRLGQEQKPDAVVCRVDARWRGIPRRLGALDCPKVLLVAGSSPPLARIWRYLQAEPFDRVVFLHHRHHAEQFRAAGCPQACWFPALALPHRDADLAAGGQAERDRRLALASSCYHPRRDRLAAVLADRKVTLTERVLGWEDRLDFYASSLVGVNLSDDGESDFRLFEILASGALLLTGRPPPESGLAELWQDGREIVTYGDDAELAEKAAYYVAHPAEARAVGEAGRQWYAERFGESRRRSAWRDLVGTGRIPEEFSLKARPIGAMPFAGGEAVPAPPAAAGPDSAEAREVERARLAMEEGDYDESFALARAVLAKNSRSLDALFIVAEMLRDSGNLAVLLKTLNMARRLSPGDPRIADLEKAGSEPPLARKKFRKMRAVWNLYEEQRWEGVLRRAEQTLERHPDRIDILHLAGSSHLRLGHLAAGLEMLRRTTRLDPARTEYWLDLGFALRQAGALAEAATAFARAVDRAPDCAEAWLALGKVRVEADQPEAAAAPFARVLVLQPANRIACRWLEACRAAGAAAAPEAEGRSQRDLLICTLETNRRHGQGVLLLRYFPDSREFVTLRCLNGYDGDEEFGGANVLLPMADLTDAEVLARLRRLLAPYRIRRILCVPCHVFDFRRAVLVKKLTAAPLCTFVMDDQTIYPNKLNQVPIALARELFAASDLRLAISPEMRQTYAKRFGQPFDLLPPTIASTDGQVPNHWQPDGSTAYRCALIGNIWTQSQLKLLRAMTRSTGLQVDWFGRHDPSWPPEASPQRLEADGIFCRGFIPEEELAVRLASYPFVLLPSGTLDGTEDSEWLTRLSFPSRIVFIVVRTLTPILVLGHPETVPGRFVTRCGLGLCTGGALGDARVKVARMADPIERSGFLANARRVAPCLVLPDSGAWIWRSLAAGRAVPAPFDDLFGEQVVASGAKKSSNNGEVITAPGLSRSNRPEPGRTRALTTT